MKFSEFYKLFEKTNIFFSTNDNEHVTIMCAWMHHSDTEGYHPNERQHPYEGEQIRRQ